MTTLPARVRRDAGTGRPGRQRREIAQLLQRKRRFRAGIVALSAAAVAIALVPQLPLRWEIPTSRAVEMLIVVAAGTMTFIGVVFSLLFLVVQFASTAFTPRLNMFHEAPIVWRTFAFYLGVVCYSFTAALVIGRDERTSSAVPLVALVGVLGSIALYRRLQATAFTSVHLDSTLALLARRGREEIDDLYAVEKPSEHATNEKASCGSSPTTMGAAANEISWPHPAAVIQVIDVPRLLRAAQRANCVIELQVASGQLVAEGAIVARVGAQGGAGVAQELLRAITAGEGRTFEQDPTLAFRLLADIALRALSPAVNDPTTAVQVIERMGGLLRALVTRDLDVGHIADRAGTTRVTLVLPSWGDYVGIALDEIIALPAHSPNVARQLTRVLDELSEVAPADRKQELEVRRDALAGPATAVPPER